MKGDDRQATRITEFAVRVVQDAMAQGSRDFWLRRAAVLEEARPKAGDFHGQATRDALSARWVRLTEQAKACRAAAAVALLDHDLGVDGDHDLGVEAAS